MPLSDHDPEKWIYRPHTAAKHEVLRKYLEPWVNKLTRYNEKARQRNKIRIVDCFAGRGDYSGIEGIDPVQLNHISTPSNLPGSPQIILDVSTYRDNEFQDAECVFIENDSKNYGKLRNTLDWASGVSDKISIQTVRRRFEKSILDFVETDGTDCPTFLFIDPFGFKSLDYEVITQLGSTPQFEFLITFMSRDMNRFLDSSDHRDALDTVFGTTAWRDEIGSYDPENWEPLVEYYTDRLEEEGPEHTFEYLIQEPDTLRTVYYLVFGTNHLNGLHTMREVMATCGTGRFAYAPKDPQYDRQQQTFGAGIEQTKEFLLERFAGYRIPFQALVQTCAEEEKYRDETESDYRKAIRELEHDDELEIVRITSKSTGIQGQDLIDFPE